MLIVMTASVPTSIRASYEKATSTGKIDFFMAGITSEEHFT